MVDDKKINEAEKLGIDPTDTDVDAAYAEMASRMRITPERLTKSLESQGIHPDTLKQWIKADMALQRLYRAKPDGKR